MEESPYEAERRQLLAELNRASKIRIGLTGTNPAVTEIEAQIAALDAHHALDSSPWSPLADALAAAVPSRRVRRDATVDALTAAVSALIADHRDELVKAADAADERWQALVDRRLAAEDAARTRSHTPSLPPSSAPGWSPATPAQVARFREGVVIGPSH